MKTCTKCNIEKEYSDFYKFNRSKDGYTSHCKECRKKEVKKYREENKEKISVGLKLWRHKNKEKIKESKKLYYEDNKEEILIKNKKYRDSNKEFIKELNDRYQKNNKEKLKEKKKIYNSKESSKENMRNWRKNNINKVKEYRERYTKTEGCKKDRKNWYNKLQKERPHIWAWRSVLSNSLKRLDTKKSSSTIKMLGYSAEDLKIHLESLFTIDMSWDNYGEWHIDHKKPVSLYDKDTDVSIVNSLDNLQPLWKLENLSKGNRYNK